MVGFSDNIFHLLEVKIRAMSISTKCCVVVFDEMSLKLELAYDGAHDSVEGLVELPDKQSVPCNEALVFMVRGLAANWKQTLGFFFTRNAARTPDLRRLLLLVIGKLRAIGLRPVATVCDQAATNRSLYRSLGVTQEEPHFEVRR